MKQGDGKTPPGQFHSCEATPRLFCGFGGLVARGVEMTFPFRNTVSPSQKCFCPHSSGSSCFPLTEPRLPSCLQERTGLLLEGEPRTSLRLRSRQPGSSLHAGFFFHNEGRASVMLPSRACSRNPTFRPGGCGHWMSLLFRGNLPKATGGEAMVGSYGAAEHGFSRPLRDLLL